MTFNIDNLRRFLKDSLTLDHSTHTEKYSSPPPIDQKIKLIRSHKEIVLLEVENPEDSLSPNRVILLVNINLTINQLNKLLVHYVHSVRRMGIVQQSDKKIVYYVSMGEYERQSITSYRDGQIVDVSEVRRDTYDARWVMERVGHVFSIIVDEYSHIPEDKYHLMDDGGNDEYLYDDL